MDQNVLIIAVVVVISFALLIGWAVRGRRQRVEIAQPTLDAPPPAPTLRRTAFDDDLAAQIAAFDPPSAAEPVRNPDNLMHLKGIGPRLAKTLYDMGIGKFSQIAAWTDEDIARIDARLGPFAGRIKADRWVEQARLLAAGEVEAYEAEFGKLGSFAA